MPTATAARPTVRRRPGPALPAIRLRSAPALEPPYDDEAAAPSARATRHRAADVSPSDRWQTEAMGARFLLLSDVATELNVSDSQVYHLVRSGELPAIKIGGRGQWRVERARLEEYIERKYAETADWVRENPLVERDPD